MKSNRINKIIKEEIKKMVNDSIQVWHGSPYDFDTFKAEKIGSGEGAQAFGWGLYFTDVEDIAQQYSNSISKIKYGGDKELIGDYINSIMNYINNPNKYSNWRFRVYKDKNYKYFINTTNNYHQYEVLLDDVSYEESLPYMKERVKTLKKAYNEFDSGNRLYQVTLHKGKTSDQYDWLIWDKPITPEQSNKIQKQFNAEEYNGRIKFENDKPYKHWGGVDEITTGKDFYRALAGDEGFTEKEASLFLLRAGIDGIKYPAESISMGTTSDNSRGFNYVIFDPNAVTIEKKIKSNATA